MTNDYMFRVLLQEKSFVLRGLIGYLFVMLLDFERIKKDASKKHETAKRDRFANVGVGF